MISIYNSLQGKLALFIILLVVAIIFILAFYSYNKLEESLYSEKKLQLRYLIDTALGTIEYYHSLVDAGELSREEAQLKVQAELKSLRLGPDNRGYFWIQTHSPVMVMHPFNPKLEGNNLAEIQDREGNLLFQRIVNIVEEQGAGFINYYWQYYGGEDRVEPKLSYVKEFAPWNWIVGTGIYINDIQTSLVELRKRIIIISLFSLVIAVTAAYLITQYIIQPIRITTRQAELIADGNLEEEIPTRLSARKDEIGLLARTFTAMTKNLKALITDYQNTEAELRKSRENLSQTLQSIGDGVIVTDNQGHITRLNPEAERLTGWALSAAVGRRLGEVFKIAEAETGNKVENPVDKVLASGQVSGLANDTVLIAKDGTKYQIADSAAPIKNKQDDIVGVILVFKDITDKYRQEQQLKKSEKKYRTLVNQSPIGIFRTTSNGKPLSVNPALADMLGCKNEAEALQFYENLSAKLYVDSDRRQEFITQLKQQGKVTNFEYKAYRADGKQRWLKMDARISEQQEEDLFIIDGFTIDITERKQAEEALQKKTEALETFFNVTPDLLCIADLNGNFIKVNQAWENILGYKVTELENSNFLELVHPDDREATNQAIKQLKTENRVLNFINRYQTKDGNYRYLEWRSHSQGGLIYGASRDITERKHQEDKIKYISFHDNLTGLYNRTYLEEEINRLDVKRQLPISLIMADLNGLKIINDTYGHERGDEILIKTAEILKSSCRREDIVARWGGDEFVILLPQTDKQAGQKIYNRIKKLCRETDEDEIPVSIALGVAAKSNSKQDIFAVLNKAEERMYKNKLDESRSTKSHIVKALLKTLGEKSNETEAHAWRMQKQAFLMGEKLNLSQAKLDKLSLLATLHDIGKTIVPSEILTKSGRLTDEEWKTIKEHPETGYRIAAATEEFAHVADEILCHHERWDGSGYPRGLEGKEIPLLSRIISIVDAYDVMTNGRSYKEAMSQQEALEELKRCAGSQFDPQLVNYFEEIKLRADD